MNLSLEVWNLFAEANASLSARDCALVASSYFRRRWDNKREFSPMQRVGKAGRKSRKNRALCRRDCVAMARKYIRLAREKGIHV